MRHEAHYVDELTTRGEGGSIGRIVPLADIEPDLDQPRSSIGDLTELIESVRNKGVLEPILVRPNPDYGPGEARYRIISGERRFRAAQQAELDEVPVIEMEVDADEALEIGLIENLQRKDLTPFEEADAYRALGDRFGYTQEKIATSMGKSRTVITESLSLLLIPDEIRQLAESLGVSSKSLLLEVAKLDDEDEMQAVVQRAAEGRISRDDLREKTRQRPAPKQQAEPSKPYVFKFKAPDKSYNLSLSFRQETVDPQDLIHALEETLVELRREVQRRTGAD
jgi:ParB family chromosome partitioning protein